MNKLVYHIAEITQFAQQQGWQVLPYPKLRLNNSPKQTSDLFCPTADYNPTNNTVTLYVAQRHPKDVLRSYAHELYHHHQNLSGQMTEQSLQGANDPNYAQNNQALRELEEEAYKCGNMLFRDWADSKK